MNKIQVQAKNQRYDILIQPGIHKETGSFIEDRFQPSKIVIIADAKIIPHYTDPIIKSFKKNQPLFIAIPEGETSKTIKTAEQIYNHLADNRIDRKALIVAAGGGVIGDLAGFVAATWLRGIDYIHVPTTLLAQVDSSIGGKTAVNLSYGKNLVGAFHPPRLVLTDPSVLSTLPTKTLACGFAEIVKHGVILDKSYFNKIEQCAEKLIQKDIYALTDIITGSVQLKANIVNQDEHEQGIRALLNFGHTFGHAWEKCSDFKLSHGYAVAMGMIAACRLGEKMYRLDESVRKSLTTLLKRLELPTVGEKRDANELIDVMYGDKKTAYNKLRFIIPTMLGEGKVVIVEDVQLLCEVLTQTMSD